MLKTNTNTRYLKKKLSMVDIIRKRWFNKGNTYAYKVRYCVVINIPNLIRSQTKKCMNAM